jgi:hypothetical protein
MKYAIKNLSELPSIEDVRKISQGLALLDTVVMPEWENRYFSFNNNWDGKGTEAMASMRDGSGSEYFLHFSIDGVAGKVLCNGDSASGSPARVAEIPTVFSAFTSEAAFSVHNATFFFWRQPGAKAWSASPANLKEYPLLGFLVGGASTYHAWAEAYYETRIDRAAVAEVFASLKISPKQLSVLSPDRSIEELTDDIEEIVGN